MNCAEFQDLLPEVTEGDLTPELQRHTSSCMDCTGLWLDLKEIAATASQLQGLYEPSPRVWNLIEIALRQEGIIHDSKAGPALVPSRSRSWSFGWLAPALASVVLVLGVGVVVHNRTPAPVAVSQNQPESEDDLVLDEVAERTPALRAAYASDLQNVNSYIRTSQDNLKLDPNDEDARQSLMQAYEQRSMVYAMALDHSLQ